MWFLKHEIEKELRGLYTVQCTVHTIIEFHSNRITFHSQ